MEFLILLVLLAVFLLPSFFMMRKQNQRQKDMAAMQAGLQPGNRVVTGAGLHGTVHQVRETEIDLEVAPGTQPGQTIVLEGEGMPRLRREGHGNLIAHVNVMVPNELDDKTRSLLEEIRDLRAENSSVHSDDDGDGGFFSRLRGKFRNR